MTLPLAKFVSGFSSFAGRAPYCFSACLNGSPEPDELKSAV
jgi:hypothetical protein